VTPDNKDTGLGPRDDPRRTPMPSRAAAWRNSAPEPGSACCPRSAACVQPNRSERHASRLHRGVGAYPGRHHRQDRACSRRNPLATRNGSAGYSTLASSVVPTREYRHGRNDGAHTAARPCERTGRGTSYTSQLPLQIAKCPEACPLQRRRQPWALPVRLHSLWGIRLECKEEQHLR
jgi:hypothetical protein